MTEFGNLLRYYRRNCTDPERGGSLTQERLGEFIGRYLGDLGFTGAAISNWENGRSAPSQNDRLVLLALVKALHHCGGLPGLVDANRLLAAGNYLTLLSSDIQEIDPAWFEDECQAQAIPEESAAIVTEQRWARLKPFLPETLYRQMELAPREGRQLLCLDQLKQLLRTVATYLPHHLALSLLKNDTHLLDQPQGTFLAGTLLFADISGFTNLSERLRRMGGKEGAEELVRIINEYLDVMLAILFQYGGQLIKFGGDAMLCLFTGENQGAMEAIWAAWEMKDAMALHFAEVEALHEVFPLSMKVGHSSGLLFATTVGNEIHQEYIITGSAVERTARAEAIAQRGQVIISAETYQEVKEWVQVEGLPESQEYFRVISVFSKKQAHSQSLWATIEQGLSDPALDVWEIVAQLERLAPYLPVGLLPQLVYDPRLEYVTGQHRQVTVLFANFVGMNDIIEAYGTGRASAITNVLNHYFQLMQEEAHYYGGVTNKVDLYDQGDKLMVLFGAPVAHERDARRAALAALAMQQALHRVSDPLAAVFLRQRIGVHSGFVFAGHVGSDAHHRREYTVMGDTVNLAARLMSAADAGEVLISAEVWQQIAPEFGAEALPDLKLKGISEPVAAYRLLEARDLTPRERPRRMLHAPLVGREQELQELVQLADGLLFGEGKKVIALTGEGGVGKSRLVAEWKQQVQRVTDPAQTVRWLYGYSHSYGQRTYGVFIEIIEQLINLSETDTPSDKWNKLGQLLRASQANQTQDWTNRFISQLAYLGYFLGFDLGLRQGLNEYITGLEAETLRLQTWLALADLFTYVATLQPLILILEDWHWADEASLDLLQFLVDKIDDRTPILFCLVFRAQKEHPTWQIWQSLCRDYPYCQAFSLRELGAGAGENLLMKLLQTEQTPDPALTGLMRAETDGNPLYIEEVLHRLLAEELLMEEQGVWRLARPISRTTVPDSLYQVIQSRIDDLDFGSPGARRILWLAAVLGTTFTEAALRYLFESLGREVTEFQRHMRELGNAALLERARVKAGEGELPGFRFRHGLVQQVAYENMPITHRRQYHRQVAEWIEVTRGENLQPFYECLSEHYDRANHAPKALHYHHLAGQQDTRAFANARARAHFERALELAGAASPPAAVLGQIHFELGKVLAVMGEYDQALERLKRAFELYGDTEAIAARVQICYEIGRLYERLGGQQNFQFALEWHDTGLALLPSPDMAEAALLHALAGIVWLRRGDFSTAENNANQSLAIGQQAGARSETGFAHRLLSICLHAQGRLQEAMVHCQHSIDICAERSDLIGLAKDYANQGVLALEMDDWRQAQQAYLQAIAVLEQVGDRFQLARASCNLGDLYFHLGDLAQGLAYANQGLALYARIGSPQGQIFAHAVIAALLWRAGDLLAARQHLDEAQALIDQHDIAMHQPMISRWSAQVYLTAGESDQAKAEIERALAFQADMQADEIEPLQRLRAQVLAEQGQKQQAIEILEASLQRLQEAGLQYQTGQALLSLAQMLTKSEAAQAQRYAENARAIFASLSASLDEAKAAMLLSSF